MGTENRMKRVVFILLFLAVLAVGCGGGKGSDDVLPTPGADYSLIFNRNAVDEYELVFSALNWQSLQTDPFEYVTGTLKFGSETYYNVGIRHKGNSSYGCVPPPKKPFKVDFDRYVDNQNFHGVKKLNFSNNLWDPTLMREMLGYDTFAAAGCPASRTSHVKLYVTVPWTYNRELFGIYTMIEQVDKVYLADRFPDNDGNLYKAAMWGGDLKWLGSDPAPYRDCYVKKTNEVANDWSDLIGFLNVLNNTPDISFKTEIEKVFNVDGFLSYLAANTVLSSLDSIAGRNCNFYLYHNPVTDKFELLPWDLNEVFGNHTLPRDNGLTADEMLTFDIRNPVSTGDHILIERILNVPEYMTDYLSRIQTLVEGYFSPVSMHAEIDKIYNLIKADVYLDIYKEFSSGDFDLSIEQDIPNDFDPERILGLKPFVTQRVANILSQLGP
jgi:spore coat protein CotH